MKGTLFFIIFFTQSLSYLYCQSYEIGTFIDKRDKQAYKFITVGNISWMVENLNYKTRNDSWCYDDNLQNCKQYGRLYSFEAAEKACPQGWHLPSKEEYERLFNIFSKEKSGFFDLADFVKNNNLDISGGGWRNVDGKYNDLDGSVHLWTSTLDRLIFYYSVRIMIIYKPMPLASIEGFGNRADLGKGIPSMGLSVRCMRDN